MKYAVIGIALVVASSAYADRVFKWRDETGQTVYSTALPPSTAYPVERVIDTDRQTPEERERAELRGRIRQIEDQQFEMQRQIAPQSRVPQYQEAPHLPGPPELSASDRERLGKLRWELDELRDTKFGTPAERATKRKDINREIEIINGRYGGRVSDQTTVIVNNPSPEPIHRPPVHFWADRNGRGVWGSDGSYVPVR